MTNGALIAVPAEFKLELLLCFCLSPEIIEAKIFQKGLISSSKYIQSDNVKR